MNHVNTSLPGKSAEGEADQYSVLDWAARKGVTGDVLSELGHLAKRRKRRRVAATSTIMMIGLFVLGGVLWPTQNTRLSNSPVISSTSTAVVIKPAHKVLPDGSIVEQREGAVVSVEFTSEVRRVVLHQGTAFFQVAKDSSWPFVVEVQGMEVNAVGTAFIVQAQSTGVDVVVTEGRVAMDMKNESTRSVSKNATFAGIGERVTADVTKARPVVTSSRLSEEELAQQLSWRSPLVQFSGTPLAEAVEMFNQYNSRKLELRDDSIKQLQISGNLRANNLPALLTLLSTNFGVEADQQGATIVLRRSGR